MPCLTCRNLMIVTHLYTKEHVGALLQTLPEWRKLAPSSQIIVGYYQSRLQPSDFRQPDAG
jgi:hypothetical protein